MTFEEFFKEYEAVSSRMFMNCARVDEDKFFFFPRKNKLIRISYVDKIIPRCKKVDGCELYIPTAGILFHTAVTNIVWGDGIEYQFLCNYQFDTAEDAKKVAELIAQDLMSRKQKLDKEENGQETENKSCQPLKPITERSDEMKPQDLLEKQGWVTTADSLDSFSIPKHFCRMFGDFILLEGNEAINMSIVTHIFPTVEEDKTEKNLYKPQIVFELLPSGIICYDVGEHLYDTEEEALSFAHEAMIRIMQVLKQSKSQEKGNVHRKK